VLILTWSGALIYTTWNPDNYAQVLALAGSQNLWVQLGRPLMDVLYRHGFQSAYQPPLQLLLGLMLLIGCGLMVSRLWKLRNANERLLLILLLTTFPFLINIFGFETGKASIPLSYTLSIAGFSLACRRPGRWWLLGSFLFAAGCSLYQNTINILIVCATVAGSFDLMDSNSAPWKNLVRQRLLPLLLLLIAGLPIYALSAELCRQVLQAGLNPRYGLMGGPTSPLGLIAKLRDIGAHYKYFLLPGHPLLPTVFGLTMAVAYLLLLIGLVRGLQDRQRRGRLLGAAVLLGAAHLFVWATDLPIKGSLLGDGYRHTYPVVVVFSAVLLLAWRQAGNLGFRRCWPLPLLLSLSLASFVITAQTWAFNTHRIALFEQSVVNRLIVRLEEDPHFRRSLPVLVVGGLPPEHRPAGLPPLGYDVYGSALDQPYATQALMNSLGLAAPSPTAEKKVACNQLAASMPLDQALAVNSYCAVVNLSAL
jgi:hypothetical protein